MKAIDFGEEEPEDPEDDDELEVDAFVLQSGLLRSSTTENLSEDSMYVPGFSGATVVKLTLI